jgi:hypothetical protein
MPSKQESEEILRAEWTVEKKLSSTGLFSRLGFLDGSVRWKIDVEKKTRLLLSSARRVVEYLLIIPRTC